MVRSRLIAGAGLVVMMIRMPSGTGKVDVDVAIVLQPETRYYAVSLELTAARVMSPKTCDVPARRSTTSIYTVC